MLTSEMVSVQYGMGPSQAVCHQVQRVRMYKGDHLVFETSQVMDDIPYGDRFKVEARWDIVNTGPDTCQASLCSLILLKCVSARARSVCEHCATGL